jgi:hypothetical protein
MITACWEDQLAEEAISNTLGNMEQTHVLAKRCVIVLDNGLEQRTYLLEPTASRADRSMLVLDEEDFTFPSMPAKSKELESTNPLVAASRDCGKHALWHYVCSFWALLKHVLCKSRKKRWQKHPFFAVCTDDGVSAYNAQGAVDNLCATGDAGSTLAARQEHKEVLLGEKEESALQSVTVPQESTREPCTIQITEGKLGIAISQVLPPVNGYCVQFDRFTGTSNEEQAGGDVPQPDDILTHVNGVDTREVEYLEVRKMLAARPCVLVLGQPAVGKMAEDPLPARGGAMSTLKGMWAKFTHTPKKKREGRGVKAEGDQNILRHVCAVEDSKLEANKGYSSFDFLEEETNSSTSTGFHSSALPSRNNPARVIKIKVSHDVPLGDINVRPYLYAKRTENEDESDAVLIEALVIPIMKRTKLGTRLWFRRIAVPDILIDFSIWTKKKKVSQNREQGVLTYWGARELQLAAIFDRHNSALAISSVGTNVSKLRDRLDICVSAAQIMKYLLYDELEEWDGRHPDSYISNVARFQREQSESYIGPLAQLGVVSVRGDLSLGNYESMWNTGSSNQISHACRVVSSGVTTTLSAFGYRVGNNLGGNTCES